MPLVVSVGGLDFIDFQAGEFPPRMDERIYMMHNANTAHIKLLPDEAEITTARFAARIEKIDYPVKLLIPTDGMRHNTRKGEALYYKEVDDIIIRQLKEIRIPMWKSLQYQEIWIQRNGAFRPPTIWWTN